MFFQLPQEVIGLIFSYDVTYYEKFDKILEEIPDQIIHYTQRRTYRKNRYEILASIRTLGTFNHLFFRVNQLRFFYDFSTIVYMKPVSSRFVYNNLTVDEAREEAIDTRIRYWEWWILLDQHIYISCSYRQNLGIIFEILDTRNLKTIHFTVLEYVAHELYRQMKAELGLIDFYKTENFAFHIPNRPAIISDTEFHYYA